MTTQRKTCDFGVARHGRDEPAVDAAQFLASARSSVIFSQSAFVGRSGAARDGHSLGPFRMEIICAKSSQKSTRMNPVANSQSVS